MTKITVLKLRPSPISAGGNVLAARPRLGGSSSINAMVYIRGNAYDYDHWSQLGNQGWSYESVLPYFKRAEDFSGDGDEEYHGHGGPLSVQKSNRTNDELLDVFVEAGQQAGILYQGL